MALITCKECKHNFSSTVNSCPSCGAAAPKKSRLLTWVVGCFIVAVAAGAISNSNREQPPINPADAARKAATSANQNAAIRAAQLIKTSMKDPESFVLKSLVVKDDGTACYSFRAKNAFNASLESSAVMTPGKTPQMLLEERDSNRFVKAWNERCTKAGGEDITDFAARMLAR